MKKILAFVLFASLLLTLAIPAAAVGEVQLFAPQATINIDGNRDDGYGDPVNINAYRDGFEGGATGVVWTAWDADYLYFYIEVNDTTPNHEHGSSWERDCIEIFLDWDNHQGDGNDNDDHAYWQIRVASAPNEDGDQLFNTRNGQSDDEDLMNAIKYVAMPKDGDYKNGYIIELAAPYKIAAETGTAALAEGRQIIVDFQIADNFEGDRRDSQAFLTSEDADGQYGNPTACHGMLNLIAAKPASADEGGQGGGEDADNEIAPVITTSTKTGDSAVMLIVLMIALLGAVAVTKKTSKNRA